MAIWTFYDFLDASGESVIEEWFTEIGLQAEAFIERRLRDMMPLRLWPEKWASKYKPTELIELRIAFNKVQYRPLGCYAPDIVFGFWLLKGTIEKGKIPSADITTALNRRKLLLDGKAEVKAHEF
jgi:hypothetical protein